jgi:DNA-binding response OmpR family regulator
MSVDAYFDKPIPPKALLAKVAELLGRGGGPR